MSAPGNRPIARPTPRLRNNHAGLSQQQPQQQTVVGSSSSASAAGGTYRPASEEETFQERDKRIHYANVLANHEELMWLSVARNEVSFYPPARSSAMICTGVRETVNPSAEHVCKSQSIAQTRLHYEALLSGFESADPRVEWPTEYQPVIKEKHRDGTKSPAGAGKGKAKVVVEGRQRTSIGGESSSSARKKERRSLGGA